MSFKPGDEVIVEFDGAEHPGEVERASHGWVHCRIPVDLTDDYHCEPPPEALVSEVTICVRESHVRPA